MAEPLASGSSRSSLTHERTASQLLRAAAPATRSRRQLAIYVILMLCAFLFGYTTANFSSLGTLMAIPAYNSASGSKSEMTSPYPPEVLGAPRESFRDNLRNDTNYVTTWSNAGWTNIFMSYVNVVYLAVLANRVAVLPPFAPSHVGSSAGFVNVSDVFDLPRLSSAVGVPIIEWSDLKTSGSEYLDELGCWSIWATASLKENERDPRRNAIEPFLALDLSHTPVPERTILVHRPTPMNDLHVRFSSLASLLFPDGRKRARLPESATFPGRKTGHKSLPDEQMACFDFMYYVAGDYPYEYEYDFSPAWRFVGMHAHWSPQLMDLAMDAIRQTFGLGKSEEVPPFISLHVRRGDFVQHCQGADKSTCFAPLSVFGRRVDEVRTEIREKYGMDVEKVLVTSDEGDSAWWEAVRGMGWEWVDHARLGTEEKLGKWYAIFIDAVVQSLGTGFVGTDRSTMSLLTQRRVNDWNGGVTRMVKWGPWADEH